MSELKLKDIKFDRRNYRIHSDKNKNLIKKSITEAGLGRSIVIDAENEIIGGNGLVSQLPENTKIKVVETKGDELVVVKRTDLKTNDEKRKKLAILDNSTTDTSEFNMDMLLEDNTPEQLAELGIEVEATDVPMEEIEEDDIPEEIQTRTQKGDLWKLGDHYLLCGDSTNKADIDRLMQGNIADMVMTDPPYNVNVKNSQGMTIENDNMSTGAFSEFLNQLFEVMASVLKEGGAFYVWHGDNARVQFEQELNRHGLPVRETLVWVKNHFNLSRQDYNHMHEPCLYGWKDGKKHYFIEEYNHSTILDTLQKTDLNKLTKEQAIDLLKQIYQLPTTVIREDKPLKNDLHPCLPAGQKVFFNNKWQNIEDIKVGATNEFGTVIATTSHKANKLVEVETNGKKTIATWNHPFLVLREGKIFWIEAEQIKQKDYILTLKKGDNQCQNSLKKDISVFGLLKIKDYEWNMILSGKNTTEQSQPDIKSTIKTETKQTMIFPISNLSVPLNTNGCTLVAELTARENGKNLAVSAENSNQQQENIGTTQKQDGLQEQSANHAESNKQLQTVEFELQMVGSVKNIETETMVYNLTMQGIPAFETEIGLSHNTMKPVRMIASLIRNSSKPNEIVLDVCGGSGSTLMACEQLGRKCFINELDPKYCDVIIQRWEDFTKQKAELVVENNG